MTYLLYYVTGQTFLIFYLYLHIPIFISRDIICTYFGNDVIVALYKTLSVIFVKTP
uniref:Uncharacterized protein n=1 Tax=Rhizophagus irregularis (strain DAOM 181602 / DAOM 197198 / MUCL 43194) TaxID=747089 RepID=U9UU57_RHIID